MGEKILLHRELTTFWHCFSQGEWKPKQIDNPAYKGKWVHPEIDNPDYTADPEIYQYASMGVIGLDLWQVEWLTVILD